MTVSHPSGVSILDFGSQYTQLIARKIREAGVYCEVFPGNAPLDTIMSIRPSALVLSGGPGSVYDEESPRPVPGVLDSHLPILGICYGMQLLALHDGGTVEGGSGREYGPAVLDPVPGSALLLGVGSGLTAWMSHGDHVTALPPGYSVSATTSSIPIAAMENHSRRRYCVQFHPEVAHTVSGAQILSNFLFSLCGILPDWNMAAYKHEAVEMIRAEAGPEGRVILGLSGGVDSSVVAALLHEALPGRFTPIFVDTGLLRKGERESVEETFRGHLGMDLVCVDASSRFIGALEGVTDPERKRKIIGRVFIEVFEEAAGRVGGVTHLAQGTLYPDVIESVSFKGPSATIKSHHNVGGLPERMKLGLIEPLRELFKDEVRNLGRELGLPENILGRHPFPGPGLAVRIPGPITREDLDLLREVDAVFIDHLVREGLYDSIWQAFAVLLPVRTVGVMGDKRTYERVVALRAVTSMDGMTADWFRMEPERMAAISSEIVNKVRGVGRVVYDISSKPPATIEWE